MEAFVYLTLDSASFSLLRTVTILLSPVEDVPVLELGRSSVTVTSGERFGLASLRASIRDPDDNDAINLRVKSLNITTDCGVLNTDTRLLLSSLRGRNLRRASGINEHINFIAFRGLAVDLLAALAAISLEPSSGGPTECSLGLVLIKDSAVSPIRVRAEVNVSIIRNPRITLDTCASLVVAEDTVVALRTLILNLDDTAPMRGAYSIRISSVAINLPGKLSPIFKIDSVAKRSPSTTLILNTNSSLTGNALFCMHKSMYINV
jgi:hypothetical protein